MATLYFTIGADWDNVVKLRNEITKLENQLKNFGKTTPEQEIRAVEAQLGTARQEFTRITTEAAKAGAAIDNDFKKKIFDASQNVNGFTEKIIAQKTVIKDIEADVRRLGEAYRTALKNDRYGGSSNNALAEYNAAKKALEEEKAALFALTQERATAQLSVKKLRDEYKLMKDDSIGSTEVLDAMTSKLKGWGATILGGLGLKELVGQMIKVRGEFQAADTAIQTLLGSKEKADALMQQVREYARISPLEFSDVTAATQMMLGFNIEAEKVPRYLQAIGDVSMGDTQKFNSLTLAFSQMSATGKLMGQDLNQMINAGFNPLQQIAETTGKSIAELKEEMSKGAVSADMVQQAFIDATSAGGKFYQMSENASKTINGQLSMMQDAIDAAFNELGQASEGVIVKSISTVTKLIENYETVGKVLVGLVTTYGAYKTAVFLATAAENGHSIAMTLARTRILLTQKAQALLNATMLKNPYVLATVALGALVTTMWAAHSATSKQDEAQKRLNESFENTKAGIASEQAEIDRLFDKLRKAKEGTAEYQQTKEKIINQYGNYLNGLSAEIRTLKDVEAAYKAVSKAAREAALERGKEAALKTTQDEYGESYSSNIGKLQKNLSETVGGKQTTQYLKQIQRELRNTGTISKETEERIRNVFRGTAKYGNSQAWFTSLRNNEKMLREQTKAVEDMFQIDTENNKQTSRNNKDTKKTIEDKKKEAQAQLDALTVQEAAGKKGLELKKKIAEYDRNLEAYSTNTGKTSKNTENIRKQQSEYNVLLDKQRDETIKKQRDNQYAIWQNEIDLMEEGNKKTLEQIELDYDKQIAAIEDYEDKLRQEKIDAAKAAFEKSPGNKDKAFDASSVDVSLTEDEERLVQSMRDKADHDREKATQEAYKVELQAMRDYLKEYGTFQQQKLAIAEEYAEKIQKAQNEGERLSLEKERDKALQGKEDERIISKVDWLSAFGNLGTAFDEIIRNTLSELNAYIQTDDFRNRSAEDKKIILEAQSNLQGKVGSDATFAKLNKQLDEYRGHIQALKIAESSHKTATEALTEAEQRRDSIMDKASKEYAEANKKVAEAQTEQERTAQLVIDADNSVAEAQGAVSRTAKDLQTNLDKFSAGLNGLTSGTLSGTVDGLTNLMQSLVGSTAVINKFKDFLKTGLSAVFGEQVGGMLVESLDIVEGFLTGDLSEAIISGVLGMLDNILEGVLKGGFITKPAEALVDGLGNVLNTLTYGGFNSWLDIHGNEKEMEEEIARLSAVNEALAKAIDNLSDKITAGEATNSESIDYYRKAYQAELEWEKNQRNAIKDRASEWTNTGYGFLGLGGKGSFIRHMAGNNWSGWSVFSEILKQHAGEAGIEHSEVNKDTFFDLTPEEMKLLEAFAPKEWMALMNGEGHRNPKELIEEYIERAGMQESLASALNEKLTGYSWDGFLDSYKNLLKDLTSSTEDFAGNINELISNALIEGFVNSENIKGKVKDLYKKIALYASEDSEGGTDLTQDEIDEIRADNEELANTMLAWRNVMQQTGLIINSGSQKTTEQSATAKSAQTITQEQADELTGRVTATQIAVENGNRLKEMSTQGITALSSQVYELILSGKEHNNKFNNMLDLLAQSFLVQQEINDNTGNSAKSLKIIQADLSEIKREIKNSL